MLVRLKKILYFPLASYFRFFAGLRLRKWNPKIIVVTGSNGKTSLFNLIKAQLSETAKFSDHANSSFGIPFDILDLHRQTLLKSEWILLFLLAPICAFRSPPKKSYYVVEADCDRPGEGKFLASFLKPDIVIWLNTARTHGMYFDYLIERGKFKSVEEAIAFEFGYFIEFSKELVIVNSDQELLKRQLDRTNASVKFISNEELNDYKVSQSGTNFKINKIEYTFPYLFPEEIFYSIKSCKLLNEHLNLPFDVTFSKLKIPPGRSSIFKGIKNITIIDSCYNANFSSMTAILNMYGKISHSPKWVVLGDMLEQGSGEKTEHENLAELIMKFNFEKIILLGPRVYEFTYPILVAHMKYKNITVRFISPKEVLDYLSKNIQGKEAILFKGARFMEGIIENLLIDKSDVKKLSRREEAWERRRKKWGL